MGKLIIVRGPSGSGKSTIARHLGGRPKESWFETDLFLTNDAGQYEWSIHRLKKAFASVQNGAIKAITDKEPIVICSSVNSKLRDFKKIKEFAEAQGYEVRIIRTPGPWDPDVLFVRNKHNVPMESIVGQIKNCKKPIEGEMEWTDMSIFSA